MNGAPVRRRTPGRAGPDFFRPVMAALLCLALLFAPVFPALADAVVTSAGDDGDGSLRQAISNTTATGQTITFNLPLSNTISLGSSLALTSAQNNLTIDGDNGGLGVTLDGSQSTTGIFFLEAGTGQLTLNSLTLQNASNYAGGGIYARSALTLNSGAGGVTFSNNSATNYGGVIYAVDTLTLGGNVRFETNTAGSNGGAIYAVKALTVGDNVSFEKNTAGSNGGAISALGKLTLGANVSFGTAGQQGSGNSAKFGGAIRVANGAGIDAMAGHVGFYHNTASDKGGAIYALDDLTINSGSGGVTFSNNSAEIWGGAIYAASDLTINSGSGGMTFSNNRVSGTVPDSMCTGGAIYAAGDLTINSGAGGATFSNNSSTRGGAIYASGNLTLNTGATGDIHFTGNTMNGAANAITMNGGTLTLSGDANIIFDDPIR